VPGDGAWMIFTTHLFLFYFLPLFLLLYYAVPRRAKTLLIAVSSYAFYAWANPIWAGLMFLNSGVDYICGLLLLRLSGQTWEGPLPPILSKDQPRTRGQKLALSLSITTNLSLLAFFKYYGFAQDNLNTLARSLGGSQVLPVLAVALPVGISFYTFKSMSYAIDVYSGEARPMTNFIDYCCFEAFFPDLVAGPIIRYGAIERQMRERTHTSAKFARGIVLFGIGIGKKILVANPLAEVADAAFAAGGLHWYDAWFGLFSYAFQIYFDFSGYSDMACGLALMMGFVLIQNFNSPYKADSITDFWRRWHISLSSWLRDYLYIPLGGNRFGVARTYVNLMVVMLIGGLWHGANWTFVIWGAIHGSMLAFERWIGKTSVYAWFPRPARIAVTFLIVCLAWVFFRADTFSQAVSYLSCLFGLQPVSSGPAIALVPVYTTYHAIVFASAAILVWGTPNSWAVSRRITPRVAGGAAALLALSVMLMWTQTENPFIYFQF
jgi:alginate O-acetyltransferase complex protein AlgI